MFSDPSGKADTLISGPLPDTVRLLRSNLIYIEKRKLPSSFLNRLVRLAAFQNSEFYRAQAMRLSTFGKPRVISCAEEFQQHVALPRGLLDDALNLFEAHRIRAEIEDQVFNGNEIAVEFRGKLNKLQMKAALDLRAHEKGIRTSCAAIKLEKNAQSRSTSALLAGGAALSFALFTEGSDRRTQPPSERSTSPSCKA